MHIKKQTRIISRLPDGEAPTLPCYINLVTVFLPLLHSMDTTVFTAERIPIAVSAVIAAELSEDESRKDNPHEPSASLGVFTTVEEMPRDASFPRASTA